MVGSVQSTCMGCAVVQAKLATTFARRHNSVERGSCFLPAALGSTLLVLRSLDDGGGSGGGSPAGGAWAGGARGRHRDLGR